ncbi:response regulator [Myxococcota bacterium]|nr:response regulator [Myxococcota bacterium]
MDLRQILLVDDEADIRTIARISLSRIGGWSTRVAASGAEALALAREERPDLVLLDVMMPGMDGPETLKRLRALPGRADVPVIFLTAKAMADDHAHLRSLGVIGVLTKPFDPLTLPGQVRGIVEAA